MIPAPPGGSITIELLIAFSVFALTATAVLLTAGTAGDAAKAAATHTDLIAAADESALRAYGELREHFFFPAQPEAGEGYELNDTIYSIIQSVAYLTPCLARVTAEAARGLLSVSVSSEYAYLDESRRLGGDCAYSPPEGTWGSAGTDTYPGASGVRGAAVDALGDRVFLGTDAAPYLAILREGAYETLPNGFTLSYKPNALDAAYVGEDGASYVFAALATTSMQFAVIEMDGTGPTLVASTTLSGVDPTGSRPQAWRIFYYDERAYVSTLETAGPELHTFDVSDPEDPQELGTGISTNITFNDFVVREEMIGGTTRKYLYAATARDTGEIAVYDVSDTRDIGTVTEVMAMRTDLPGSQDGESIAVVGDRLYLGRASNTAGPELYAFQIDEGTVTQLGTAEISSVSISGIRVLGDYAYLAVTPTGITNRRVDVWDVSDPAHMARVLAYALPGLAAHGIDVALEGVYAASEREPALRRLMSD